mmetsp:Transcript_11799/g.50569  ORF Transcript_11799/g.50569 Transcript_11799/m.50569 type:complete len:248 (+) Transcript_11799:263-1006(+)
MMAPRLNPGSNAHSVSAMYSSATKRSSGPQSPASHRPSVIFWDKILNLGRTGYAASASETLAKDKKGTFVGGGTRVSSRVDKASVENSGNALSNAGTDAVVQASGLARPARRVSLTRPNVSSSQSSARDAPASSEAPPAPNVIALGSGPRRFRFARYSSTEVRSRSNASAAPGSVAEAKLAPHHGVAAKAQPTRKSLRGCHRCPKRFASFEEPALRDLAIATSAASPAAQTSASRTSIASVCLTTPT